MADIVTCHNRGSTGATKNINNRSVPGPRHAASKSNVAIIICFSCSDMSKRLP